MTIVDSSEPLSQSPPSTTTSNVYFDTVTDPSEYGTFEHQHQENEPSSIYTSVPPPTFTSLAEKLQYLENSKRKTVTQYNEAVNKVKEIHFEIQEAIIMEQKEAKTTLHDHKDKVDRLGDKIEKDAESLLKTIDESQKSLQEALKKLELGDSTALGTTTRIEGDIVDIEQTLRKTEKAVQRFQREIPLSKDPISTTERVLQDLQALTMINVEITACTSTSEEDEYILLTFSRDD